LVQKRFKIDFGNFRRAQTKDKAFNIALQHYFKMSYNGWQSNKVKRLARIKSHYGVLILTNFNVVEASFKHAPLW
jgi:hypothetical protein